MPRNLSTSSPTFPPPPSARHYNSALSIWLSVDPMADKYPSISPYAYCSWNPIKLVDPKGMEAMEDWYKTSRMTYSDIVSARADIIKNAPLKKMLKPIVLYATANSVLDYVKSIKNGSWNTSTTISLVSDVLSLVGEFYGNVISFYLNRINYVSKKGSEAESALRSYFSPLTPNNYYSKCFGYF